MPLQDNQLGILKHKTCKVLLNNALDEYHLLISQPALVPCCDEQYLLDLSWIHLLYTPHNSYHWLVQLAVFVKDEIAIFYVLYH